MNNTTIPALRHVELQHSITDIFTTALTSHIISAIAFRFLASLRKQPSSFSGYQILASLVVPTYPLAELLVGLYRTVKIRERAGRQASRHYYVCSLLEMRAFESPEDNENSMPLALIYHDNLHSERRPYNIKWATRLTTLVILLLYSLFVIGLWVRRYTKDALLTVDDLVMIKALGCLIVTLTALWIHGLNTTWQVRRVLASKGEKEFVEPTKVDFVYQLLIRPHMTEVSLAFLLAIWVRLAAYNLPGTHNLLIPYLGEADEHSVFLLWAFSQLLRLTMAYLLVWYAIFFVSSIMHYYGRPLPWICRSIYDRSWKECSATYMLVNLYLLLLASWNIGNARPWEPWMWKDPWSVWPLL